LRGVFDGRLGGGHCHCHVLRSANTGRQAFAGPIDKRPRTAREWRAQKTENCAHDNYRNC